MSRQMLLRVLLSYAHDIVIYSNPPSSPASFLPCAWFQGISTAGRAIVSAIEEQWGPTARESSGHLGQHAAQRAWRYNPC